MLLNGIRIAWVHPFSDPDVLDFAYSQLFFRDANGTEYELTNMCDIIEFAMYNRARGINSYMVVKAVVYWQWFNCLDLLGPVP